MKSKELDQYYTNPEVSEIFYGIIDKKYNLSNYHLLEPSAGTGAFSDLFHLDSTILDIDPKKDSITQMDFMDYKHPGTMGPLRTEEECQECQECLIPKKVFTIGNPPFGKNSNLAIKFFNKSAEFSDIIAFIIPKTFRKVSVQNKLSMDFKLVDDFDVQPFGFNFNGEEYDVPCCFQIWERVSGVEEKRKPTETKTKSDNFIFTNKDQADFLLQRVGVSAGKASLDFHKSPNSHYYIKSSSTDPHDPKSDLFNTFDSLFNDFQEVAKNCAGNPHYQREKLLGWLIKN